MDEFRTEMAGRLGEVRDLMPFLMKRRNGGHWTEEETCVLRQRLRGLVHFSPVLLLLVLPGTFILLPLLAWWRIGIANAEAAHRPRQTYFNSRYSSMPWREPSRPIPDCLMPPKGAASLEMTMVLMPIMPHSSASATRQTRPTSRV